AARAGRPRTSRRDAGAGTRGDALWQANSTSHEGHPSCIERSACWTGATPVSPRFDKTGHWSMPTIPLLSPSRYVVSRLVLFLLGALLVACQAAASTPPCTLNSTQPS